MYILDTLGSLFTLTFAEFHDCKPFALPEKVCDNTWSWIFYHISPPNCLPWSNMRLLFLPNTSLHSSNPRCQDRQHLNAGANEHSSRCFRKSCAFGDLLPTTWVDEPQKFPECHLATWMWTRIQWSSHCHSGWFAHVINLCQSPEQGCFIHLHQINWNYCSSWLKKDLPSSNVAFEDEGLTSSRQFFAKIVTFRPSRPPKDHKVMSWKMRMPLPPAFCVWCWKLNVAAYSSSVSCWQIGRSPSKQHVLKIDHRICS